MRVMLNNKMREIVRHHVWNIDEDVKCLSNLDSTLEHPSYAILFSYKDDPGFLEAMFYDMAHHAASWTHLLLLRETTGVTVPDSLAGMFYGQLGFWFTWRQTKI
jgi:hypothetical protein